MEFVFCSRIEVNEERKIEADTLLDLYFIKTLNFSFCNISLESFRDKNLFNLLRATKLRFKHTNMPGTQQI